MLVDDKVLRDILQAKLAIVNKKLPNTAFRKIEDYAVNNYNMKHGAIVEMVNNYRPIETLSFDELYKLTESIKHGCEGYEIDLSDLDVNKYFYESEQDVYKQKISNDYSYGDLVFDNFLESNGEFYVNMTAEQHKILRDIERIRYNPETQRDLIEIESDGLKYEKIDINSKSVNDIQNLLLRNKFKCDPLTFNINTDINTDINMLPMIAGSKLIIPKEAIIDVIDGWHRSQSLYLTKITNPEWDYTFTVRITTWNTATALDFVISQDKKNHLKPQQQKRENKEDEANFIITQIKSNSDFYISDSINKDIQFDLNIIINDIFAPTKDERRRSIDISKLIVGKINQLIYEKDYFDKQFSKEEWYIYLYIINKSPDNFIKIVNTLNIEEAKNEVSYKNKPVVKGKKYLDKIIKEVNER